MSYNSLEQYKLLIQARNFHYDNYNKWMTYFYVAMGAFFVGYYKLISSDKEGDLDFEIQVLLVVGYLTSIFWYISSKGYYYWNINFISLINYHEKHVLKLNNQNRVYYVFANKKRENCYLSPIKGANISTSKVTILFAFIITVFWGCLLLKKLFKMDILCLFCFSIFATIIISGVLGKFLKSNIKNTPDLRLTKNSDLGIITSLSTHPNDTTLRNKKGIRYCIRKRNFL